VKRLREIPKIIYTIFYHTLFINETGWVVAIDGGKFPLN
jgi:hypothetical protein